MASGWWATIASVDCSGSGAANRINFYGADLTDANLQYATLHDANLTGAYLHDVILYGADLTGADLRDAKGLER